MFKRLLMLFTMSLVMAACVTGTISDTVNVDNAIAFTVPVAASASTGVTTPNVTVTQSFPVDVASALTKINNVGNVGLNVMDNAITYNGSYAPFTNLTVYLMTLSDSSTVQVMNYNFTGTESGTIHIPVLVSGDVLYRKLSQGSNDLIFNLTVNPNNVSMVPSGTLTMSHHLSLGVSANVSKGL